MAVKFTVFVIALVASTLVALPSEPQPELENSDFFYTSDVSTRIVGGETAAAGSHPHLVALSYGLLWRSFLCGGSLLTTRTVLTAAHCTDHVFSFGSLSSSFRGTAGTNRWNSGGVTFRFDRNVSHPNYVARTIKNDVSLLITSVAVEPSSTINVVPISYDWVGGNVAVRAAGWGTTRAGGSVSRDLRELSMATIDGDTCIREVPIAAATLNLIAPPVEPHIEICTFHSRGNGMCNGDSGSALVRLDTGSIVGVVSWGIPCAVGGPDMFARVSAYSSWIQQNIV